MSCDSDWVRLPGFVFAGPGPAQPSALSLSRASLAIGGCVSVCTSADHVRQMHGKQLSVQQTPQTAGAQNCHLSPAET